VSAPGISIHYLGHHPGFAERLARWSWDEWQPIYEQRGQTWEHALRNYQERLNINTMPLALVAFNESGELVGTVSLKYYDLDIRPEITIWLGGLFVIPEWRRHGVGSQLMTRAVEEARRLELPSLHLWTSSAKSLYQKLGWNVVERMDYCGKQIMMMEFPLGK
jgi:GNAT superfamily N-acetyltransferase